MGNHACYDAAIVGGGVAGLTTAAYLSGAGYNVLLCEKADRVGGLVMSFEFKDFTFDGGIRAIENSGIVLPMLRQLGLEVEFLDNIVSIGVEDEIVQLRSRDSLQDYRDLLFRLFPDQINEVRRIVDEIELITGYMDVLYGISNPLFLDFTRDRDYLLREVLPRFFKYLFTLRKIRQLNTPIEEYLRRFTEDPVLIDMIAQHFFRDTPAFFALSYFGLYLDYRYPRGGTGAVVDALEKYIRDHGGSIRTGVRIVGLDPRERTLLDSEGDSFRYRKLIWAADQKTLYDIADIDGVPDERIRQQIERRKAAIANKTGGDSVLTLYLTVDLDPSYFESICTEHFFYTPLRKGLAELESTNPLYRTDLRQDKSLVTQWIADYLRLTTYEVSVPAMRDESLAPPGKTGLIVSTLFDHPLTRHVERMGWYEEFKVLVARTMTEVLDSSVFPGLRARVMDHFVSTPLTVQRRTGNTGEAITGWAFTNRPIPPINDLIKVSRSILTPIPDVYQAGQWTFSPSGLPISVLTAKLAANRVKRDLR